MVDQRYHELMHNEVYVEKLDISTKTSNTINASDGMIKFANNI